ncbi:MAG: hypothetical protein ACI83H_002555 [Glaciecola sp.]|jgi:hypothetical protein
MKKEKDWFKLKRYPHVGFPLEASDRYVWIEKYVTNPDKIASHSFLPFIHKTYSQRKFRKKYSENDGKVVKGKLPDSETEIALRHSDCKEREIYYAGHLDALVYSYYSQIIAEKYDEKLEQFHLSDSITAYRSIEINPEKENGSCKCNIDFANDVFKKINQQEDDEFIVMAFDISSFFDHLNHKILLNNWMQVLNVDKLEKDHFNVFKNITRFSYVDQVELFEHFKNQIWVERNKPFTTEKHYVKKSIDKIKYLRKQRAVAYCENKDLFRNKTKFIHQLKVKNTEGVREKRDFGIPQGSPISSVLANVYLLNFDKSINDFVTNYGGHYTRYSDDMVVICSTNIKDELERLVYNEIDKYKLEIQKKKTQIFYFKKGTEGKLSCGQEFRDEINWNKNFIYLGFEFNGESVLVKSASLSRYYRKMKRTIRRGEHFSNKIGSKTKDEFFKSRILKKYSYKGSKRRLKWIWNEDLKKFEKSKDYNWGNFLSYTEKSSKVMISNKIKAQTKNHWKKINKEIKK